MITGAGGALGAELASGFARRNWEPILLDRTTKRLDPVRRRIVAETGREPFIQPADLAGIGPDECADMVCAIGSGPGRLDALIHCAASFEGLTPIHQIPPETWLRDFQVNVHAAWLLTTHCLPLLRAAERSSLIFVLDDLERVAGPFWGSYGVSKWAVKAMSSQFAADLKTAQVDVHAVDPGPMPSDLRARAYHDENPSDLSPPEGPARKIIELVETRGEPAGRQPGLAT
ncbi:SDR family NAD(P)-dependent oxidoreductase [Elongatibacter sediminis]|uniref:SDR family NAD(P)-dependent oxidoreductase n=1 Tax=Elongatibacter sediminis TaxID=3119006 RepID=A0AAW9R6E4_9GAMM